MVDALSQYVPYQLTNDVRRSAEPPEARRRGGGGGVYQSEPFNLQYISRLGQNCPILEHAFVQHGNAGC